MMTTTFFYMARVCVDINSRDMRCGGVIETLKRRDEKMEPLTLMKRRGDYFSIPFMTQRVHRMKKLFLRAI